MTRTINNFKIRIKIKINKTNQVHLLKGKVFDIIQN
jgi:hypothetical protein